MAEARLVIIPIERKERWSVQTVQQGKDLWIGHAAPADIPADGTERDSATVKEGPLFDCDILIKDIHGGGHPRSYSTA